MPFKNFAVGELLTSSDVDTYLMEQVIIRCTSSTRPSTPAQGWHIYETDTGKFLVYNGTSWVNQGSQTVGVIKSALESVTNSTVLQDDDHLFVPVDANTDYTISGYLFYVSQADGGTTADIKIGLSAPSGSSLRATVLGPPTSATTFFNTVSSEWFGPGGSMTIGGLGFDNAVPLIGTLRVGGTAGNLRLIWAQATSNASPARIYGTYSHLAVTRIS